jgi:HAD superfamily hydrolase (TIGR01549 family)
MEDHVRPRSRTNALVSRIAAVLFDWGDTLFESPHAPSVILEHARAQNIPMDRDAAERMWRELFSRANARLPGIDRVLYERVMDASTWRPYPDTEPTLRALRARHLRIGVVSNHAYDVRPFFTAHGLAEYVDAYTLSYEVGVAKPSLRMFTEALRALAVDPAHALMVGDDAVSDGGAAAAGVQVHILPRYAHGGPRGLERVLQIVDESRR